MFFGVPQSRDRLYIAFWDRHLPTPDLDHGPLSWCAACDDAVEAVWSWKTGIPLSGSVRYGKQYNYPCPRCRREVIPPMTPSLNALDLTDLGARLGDRPLKTFKVGDLEVRSPLAPATMARIERCRERFAEHPAILMPAKSAHGVEKLLGQPMATQTSQQETALLSAGAVLSGVIPFRKNTRPVLDAEPMPTVTSEQIPGLVSAELTAALVDVPLEDCHFRMLGPHEVGRGCGFDTTFPSREGTFKVWGSARNQCDGFGNAVSPAVGEWIGKRLRSVLHRAEANRAAA